MKYPLGSVSDVPSLPYVAYQCYIIAFKDDPTNFSPNILLHVDFIAVVQYHIHELIEALQQKVREVLRFNSMMSIDD